MGLRERKKSDTRRALSDAALRLAFERGIDDVTREAIAELAGVSLRTFNNYFTGKYEAFAYRQTERLRRSIAALCERPVDEPLWTSITEAVLQPLEEDFAEVDGDEDRVPTRQNSSRSENCSSAPRCEMRVSGSLFDEWVEVIAERTRHRSRARHIPAARQCRRARGRRRGMETYANADPPVADNHPDAPGWPPWRRDYRNRAPKGRSWPTSSSRGQVRTD